MGKLRNTFDTAWAALMLFTRLPLWRLYQPRHTRAYRRAPACWPLAGWVTSGVTALTFVASIRVWPLPLAVLTAIAARILLDGALHEDGLADFADGMGGGRDREHTLRIMKDSHTGTYGVIALVLYLLVYAASLHELALALLRRSLMGSCHNPLLMMWAAMLTADVWAKCCSSLLVGQLPYARKTEEAKTGLTYQPLHWGWHLTGCTVAMLPALALWHFIGEMPPVAVFVVPMAVELLLALWMHLRLRGYTGDCCGATFLLCETSIYLTWLMNF